jgi:hypothetical protein
MSGTAWAISMSILYLGSRPVRLCVPVLVGDRSHLAEPPGLPLMGSDDGSSLSFLRLRS